MVAAILAGGKGVRLWPESRRHHPKQLCKLLDDKSMLDHTIDRLISTGWNRIIIITSDDLLEDIQTLVDQREEQHIIEVLSEPQGKNTAPAVGLVLARLLNNNDEILGIFPADHHVLDPASFRESLYRASMAAAHNHIATIGIEPDRPETGYGYIEKTRWEVGEIGNVFEVGSFAEKPDIDTAKSYLETGNYMWNAGIYVGKIGVFLEEFNRHLPDVYCHITPGYEHYISSYPELPSISLDNGIAEKSSCMAVVPSNFGWCDLGSWNALAEVQQADQMNNICGGSDIIIMDSSNCVVKQKEKTIVLYGVEDLLVVESDHVLLISDRNKCQDIRKITDFLDKHERYDLL